ncbi:MAG TPA: DNA-3-methyladenine glycosylase [Nitrososphaeraceae archaeon]|nr:DNA-3-methyladenine glycosylase [Nitrososphaeraceae archaeon]
MTIKFLNHKIACLELPFYERDTAEVAKSLLGKIIVRKLGLPGSISTLAGYIIETEAYGYRDDPASHAFSGLRPRNSVMFGDVGRLYVYFVYGKHFCANVTARKNDTEAGAVLIRSIMPLAGQAIMNKNRKYSKNLTTGPGRTTEAMSITLADNGLDVTKETSTISIHHGLDIADFSASTRVGVSKAIDRPWRYTATRFASDLKIEFLPS